MYSLTLKQVQAALVAKQPLAPVPHHFFNLVSSDMTVTDLEGEDIFIQRKEHFKLSQMKGCRGYIIEIHGKVHALNAEHGNRLACD